MAIPAAILDVAFQEASLPIAGPFISDQDISKRIEDICRYLGNRALARFILACTLAKVLHPEYDIRKPYTEIPGATDSYSGRSFDEAYITPFVLKYSLPCNPTTAFLTPAFRNRNAVLTPDLVMSGRPERLYRAALQLLTDIQEGHISAQAVLYETVCYLLMVRTEREEQIQSLLGSLKASEGILVLSSEAIVRLIEQHLALAHSSRLPVLVVAAAYQAAEKRLGESVLPFESHNAADAQTGALGDLEITLEDEDRVVTSYEMKTRQVNRNDIDQAIQKINSVGKRIDHYLFITTETIEESVKDYAASMYQETGGIEIAILDCISFLRHFLHLFHRLRAEFLDTYQLLVLNEPDSAVDHPLKVAFLALRQAAESAPGKNT